LFFAESNPVREILQRIDATTSDVDLIHFFKQKLIDINTNFSNEVHYADDQIVMRLIYCIDLLSHQHVVKNNMTNQIADQRVGIRCH
jgi:hypothetical protein